jgi:photosystem II stability/assembly factor-like uncharacterized protein
MRIRLVTNYRTLAAILWGVAAPLSASALQWEAVGPDGGPVDGLVQSRSNPDRMYALLHAQGIHRSDDGGQSWARVDVGLPQGASYVAIGSSPINADFVLVAPLGGNDILRSTDGGVSWNPYTVAAGLGLIRDIEFDPFNANSVLITVEGGSTAAIHRSTNGGLNWAPSNTGFTSTVPWQIEYHPSTAGTVLVAASGGVFRSTNGGLNWSASNMNGHGTIGAVSYCRNSPGTVWSADETPNRFLMSTDGGLSFSNVGNALCNASSCTLTNVVADVSNTATILGGFKAYSCGKFCYSSGYIRRSTNSGTGWGTPSTPNGWREGHQSFSTMFFDATFPTIAYSSIKNVNVDGLDALNVGIIRSTDSGANWAPLMNGLHGASITKIRADGMGRVYAMGRNHESLWRSENSGDSWFVLGQQPEDPSGHEGLSLEISRGVPGLLHEAGGFWQFDIFTPRLFRSTNFGADWVEADLPDVGLFAIPECVASDPITGQAIYMWCSFGSPGFLFRSTDGGASFDVLDEVLPAEAAIVSPADPAHVVAMFNDSPQFVLYSTDSGVSWTQWASGLPSGNLGKSLLGSESNLIAVFRTAGAYRSAGLGQNWTPIALPGYEGEPVVDSDYDATSDRLILCTETGEVYVQGVGYISQGLAGTPKTVALDPGSESAFTGTDYASTYRLDLGGAVDAPMVGAPRSPLCSISARPNPARDLVHFSITLVHDVSHAKISIHDVRGRRIVQIEKGMLPRGTHDISWETTSSDGAKLAQGIYFARLEAGGQTSSARIVLRND